MGSGDDAGCEGESNGRAGTRGKVGCGRCRVWVNRWRVGVSSPVRFLKAAGAKGLAGAVGERVLGGGWRRGGRARRRGSWQSPLGGNAGGPAGRLARQSPGTLHAVSAHQRADIAPPSDCRGDPNLRFLPDQQSTGAGRGHGRRAISLALLLGGIATSLLGSAALCSWVLLNGMSHSGLQHWSLWHSGTVLLVGSTGLLAFAGRVGCRAGRQPIWLVCCCTLAVLSLGAALWSVAMWASI